jgi:hypothetical protein
MYLFVFQSLKYYCFSKVAKLHVFLKISVKISFTITLYILYNNNIVVLYFPIVLQLCNYRLKAATGLTYKNAFNATSMQLCNY